jgi:hypothetical protein
VSKTDTYSAPPQQLLQVAGGPNSGPPKNLGLGVNKSTSQLLPMPVSNTLAAPPDGSWTPPIGVKPPLFALRFFAKAVTVTQWDVRRSSKMY